MKINTGNTALGLLDHITPYSFRIAQDAEHSSQEYKTRFGLSVVENFPLISHRFKSKIQYISDPFYKAYNQGVSKLANVLDDEEIDECGTFIVNSTPSETNTIFYDISSQGKGADFKLTAVIFFFCKHTNMDKPSLAVYVQRNNKGVKEYFSEVAAKNELTNISVLADIFTMILFMKYCQVETKIIKPNSKALHVGCKYVNETQNNIEILDSTWFTTIVRSEGFHVRGHFRMQPYGPGMKDKKLKWIYDFDKTGYTKTAKVLSQ